MGKNRERDWEFKSFEGSSKRGRHLRITKEMMESLAWSKLSNNAIRLYLEMKIKYNQNNADNISLTYKEGGHWMAKATFTKCIDELIDYGFIKIIRQAWTSRECNIYGFCDQWKWFGTDKFRILPRIKRSLAKKSLSGAGKL